MASDHVPHDFRIGRLERQLKRAQLLACGSGLLAATLLLTGYHRRAGEVVQAERLELVTAQGVRRVILGSDTLGFSVTLLDPQERPVSTLRLTDEPWLAVQTGRGREVAGLGSPKAHHLTE